MKKNLKRILEIIIILILSYQNFTYADVIDPEYIAFMSITYLIGLICVIALVVSAISFFCLKATVKKQSKSDFNREISRKEIEKKAGNIRAILMIFLIPITVFLWELNYNFFIILSACTIILLIIAIISRVRKNKELSNILGAIILLFIVVIFPIYFGTDLVVQNYNNRIIQYLNYKWEDKGVLTDVEGLIKTIILDNKCKKNVTISYENKIYSSNDELKQLLKEINKEKKYFVDEIYDEKNGYIISLVLSKYIPTDLSSILEYEGQETKAKIKELVYQARAICVNFKYAGINYKIEIKYTNNENKTEIFSINDFNAENMNKYMENFSEEKLYDVEIQMEDDYTCIIAITDANF